MVLSLDIQLKADQLLMLLTRQNLIGTSKPKLLQFISRSSVMLHIFRMPLPRLLQVSFLAVVV